MKKVSTEARIGGASNILGKRHERHWRQNSGKERFWLNVRKEEGATCDIPVRFLRIILTITYIIIHVVVFSFYNITLVCKRMLFYPLILSSDTTVRQ